MGAVRRVRIPILAAALFAGAYPAAAQEVKTARGTVSVVDSASITLKVAEANMKFAVSPETDVVAVGPGTKARHAANAGKPGLKLSDLVQVGRPAIVTYREVSGVMQASRIQLVSSAGAGGGSTSAENTEKTAKGAVKSVSPSSLLLTADGKEMAFIVDSNTRVTGRGLGTKTAAAGGVIAISDLVRTGARVNVTYRTMPSGAMLATHVLVTGPQ